MMGISVSLGKEVLAIAWEKCAWKILVVRKQLLGKRRIVSLLVRKERIKKNYKVGFNEKNKGLSP